MSSLSNGSNNIEVDLKETLYAAREHVSADASEITLVL